MSFIKKLREKSNIKYTNDDEMYFSIPIDLEKSLVCDYNNKNEIGLLIKGSNHKNYIKIDQTLAEIIFDLSEINKTLSKPDDAVFNYYNGVNAGKRSFDSYPKPKYLFKAKVIDRDGDYARE